jgi:elongation factor Ts
VNCETDFVGRNPVFRSFAKDVAMHVAAANPSYLKREDVPADLLEKEKEIHMAQIQGKPEKIVEKIITGKLDKYFSETCLMEQPFIKDDKLTIGTLLNSKVNELGENIVINRFIRFEVGSDE